MLEKILDFIFPQRKDGGCKEYEPEFKSYQVDYTEDHFPVWEMPDHTNKCKEIEFIPVENKMKDGKFENFYLSDVINSTLKEHGEKEFLKITKVKEQLFLVVRN